MTKPQSLLEAYRFRERCDDLVCRMRRAIDDENVPLVEHLAAEMWGSLKEWLPGGMIDDDPEQDEPDGSKFSRRSKP